MIPRPFLYIWFEKGKTGGERGEMTVKKEEKEPLNWEVKDPKPPVVRSGHMEERKQ